MRLAAIVRHVESSDPTSSVSSGFVAEAIGTTSALGQERLVTEDLQPLDWKGPE